MRHGVAIQLVKAMIFSAPVGFMLIILFPAAALYVQWGIFLFICAVGLLEALRS